MLTKKTAPFPLSVPSTSERIQALEKEIALLQPQMQGKDPTVVLKQKIELLHRYNDVKDVAQKLIAIYAAQTGRTVTAVHQELDLPLIND